MNTQYRLVWNKSLRVVQVAGELTHRPEGGTASANGAVTTRARFALSPKGLSFAAWVALGMVSLIAPAIAGQVTGLITADPNAPGNQRPTVLGSPGKAALINITTPSKAGVSINQYSAFQVDAHGAVLNNSRDNTQTTVAGTIGGNPWLATGSARIIVNQVNSNSPAALGGTIEVGGDKAQVVIASPSGIAIDGGAFLNASRVTLTTGTPVVNGGALDGYRVSSNGVIQVTGNGLDASHADYTDIIARAAVLDGAIYAQQLQMTLGANQVSADQGQVTPIQGLGTKPAFALDTSALGGMYANKIVLVTNEQGVGVRNAGTMAASAGDAVVTIDGRLENTGHLQSQADTTVSASGGISNSGIISATNTLSITTPQDIDNSQGTLNAGRIAVDAASLRNQAGKIAQTGLQGMSLQAGTLSNRNGGSIGMQVADAGDSSGGSSSSSGSTPPPSTDTGASNGGSTAPSDGSSSGTTPSAPLADGALHIAGLLDNDGGHISAAAGLDLATATGLTNDGGQLELRQLTVTSGNLSNNGGTLAIDGAATIHANRVANDAGQLTFNGPLSLDAQQLSNRAGTIQQLDSGATALSVAGTFDNTNGTLTSNASSLAITSGTLINERGTITHTGLDGLKVATNALYGAGGTIATAGAVQLTAGTVDHQQATLAATQVTVNATSFDNRGGTVTASGDSANTLQVTGTLENSDGGTIASNADLSLQASTLGNANGTIQHAGTGTLRIDATTLNGAGGTLGSNGQLLLTGTTTDLSAGTASAQAVSITTGSLSTAHGTLIAAGSGPLQLAVKGVYDNTGGQVSTGGALQLSAASLINAGGSLVATGTGATNLAVVNRLDNTGGVIAAAGATTVRADDLINQGGTLQASGSPLSVTAGHLLDNSQHGVVASDGDLTIATSALNNTLGTIQHAGTGALQIDAATLNGHNGTITSQGTLTLTGNQTDLSGGTTQAQTITITTGSLSTAGGQLNALGGDPLELTIRGGFDNTGGTVMGNGALQLSAASLTNTDGKLIAAGSNATQVQIAGVFDNTRGALASAGALTLHAGTLINQAGSIQATNTAPLTLTVDSLLTNDQGALQSNGDIHVAAGSVSNHGGTIQTQQAINATVSGTLDNSNGGTVIAGGDLTVQAASLLNRNTLSTSAPQGLYGDHVQLQADTLDNTQGQIHANDTLAVQGRSTTGSAITNAGGAMDGTGTVTVAATMLDNTGGQLIQRGSDGSLSINATQALTNSGGGLIGAEGAAAIHAGSFDNSGGTTSAQGDLALASDGDLLNRNGGVLQTQGALTLGANGTFDNSAGQLDATGAATINAASINNVGGQLLAGDTSNPDAGLQITSNSTLDNRGGTIGNRGGDVALNAASIDNSGGGTLVAQRDLTFNTAALNNAGGTAFATRNLSYQNSGATLDNTGGQLGAGDTAWLNLAQITNNAGGHLQANTLWLTTPTLNNDGGEVDGTTVHATFANLNGIGRLYGSQELDAHITGDYTHLAGQRLESDGVLSLTVDGTLTNQGTLQTQGELDLSAANLINTNGAVINASAGDGSGVANIHVNGSIDNQQGATFEGDTLGVSANTVTNTGNIVGDVVTLDAGSVTNGRDLGTATAAVDYGEGFIGASQALNLHVGTLANLDAQLYSTGDLSIAADAAGNQAQSILNRSGLIQAEGNLSLAAQQITNERRVFQTEVYNLTPAEQAQNTFTRSDVDIYREDDPDPSHHAPAVDPSQVLSAAQIAQLEAFCSGKGSPGKDGDQWCHGITYPGQSDDHNIYHNKLTANVTDTLMSVERLVSASAAGEIVSGGDMTLVGAVLNDKSTIAAGRNLTIYDPSSGASGMASVQNIAWTPTGTMQETTEEQTAIGYVSFSGSRQWGVEPYKWTWATYQDTATINVAQGSAPGWVSYNAGAGLAGTITAGGAVTIIGGDVTNTVVGGGGGVSGLTPGGLSGPGSTTFQNATDAQASGAGTIGGTSGQAVNGPGHQSGASGQTIGDTNSPLPGYTPPNNPTVQQHPDASAPFLITTAPRFAQGASTSSDYLLRALGDDPTSVHKRLGDGYYEQNLVMDQILQLTGRRSLNGGDPMAQYGALMDGAAIEAARLGLQLGAPLTTAQIGALDTDIVWLVDQVVDGQHVLTPVVYLSKATADRMQHDGALIAGDTVNVASSGTVRNDGTISGTQGTWLSADTLINTGALKSGGTLAVATRNDTINTGTLSAGAISVTAGRDLLNTGSITSTGDMALVAGRDLTTGVAPITAGGNLAMVAGRDLTATASKITAGGDASLIAGNNLTLDATARTTRSGSPQNEQENLTHSVTSVSAGGNLALVAGNNLTSNGAQLNAGNQLGLAAGNDLNLNAVTDRQSTTSQVQQGRTRTNTSTYDETVQGSTLSGANGVALTAGHDLTATGTTISSANGNIGLMAGHDLTLNTAQETHTSSVDTKTTSGNWNAHSTTRTHDSVSDTYAVGTAISGNNVQLVAGHDLTAQAAQVEANGAIAVVAGHDVNLTDAHDVHSEEHDVSQTSTRLFNTNILDPRAGNLDPDKKSSNSTQSLTQSTSVGTLLSGDSVTVAAGHDINGTNAQIVGTHDVVLAAGNNLTLNAGQNTYTETDSTDKSHTGVMNGGGLSVMAGKRTTKTNTTIDEVSYSGSTVGSTDGSVTLSAGNNVHITGSDVLSQTGTAIVGKNVTIDAAVGTTDITQTYKQSQAGIHAGLGGAAANVANAVIGDAQRGRQVNDSRLKTLYAAKTAYDAYDLAGVAGNAQAMQGASDSNPNGISLQLGIGASSASSKTTTHDEAAYGSTIRSHGNVVIAATDGDLNVIGSQISGDNVALAASNNINLLSQAEQHTLKSDNKNASGEVGVQMGTDGIGFYAQASVGKGNAHGNGTTHATTSIDAANTLTLVSGGDTTIQGAQAKGNTVLAAIGGNLNIRSEQDTDDYASKQMQASGKVVVGMGASASGSYNQNKANSHYASVTTVSGIGAGEGGYNIHVNGNTDLKGGVIASTADASKNLLDTGSLTYSNIENEAKYSASSIGVGGGNSGSRGLAGGPNGVAPSIGIPQGDSEHSTTKAGIANGTITVRNGDTDLSGLDRNPDINAQGLKPIFDVQKVQEQQEMGQVAGYVGMRTAGGIADYMANKATTDAEQKSWQDGGTNKIILHGLVGAGTAALGGGNVIQGAAGAAGSEAASGAMQKYLDDQHITDPAQRNTLMQLASLAIGTAAGGGAGANTALAGDSYNRQLHPDYVQHLQGAAYRFAQQQCACNINSLPADQQQELMDNAANTLLQTAQRMQDDTFNAKFNGAPLDASAQAFIQKDNFGEYIGGTYYNLSQADASERANPTINGYALFTQLNKDNNGGIGALMSATGYTLDQYAGLAQADLNTGRPQSQNFDVQKQNWNNQDALSFLGFQGKLAFYGGTAGVGAEFAALSGVVSGGVSGYESAGWKGAAVGVVVGGTVGKLAPAMTDWLLPLTEDAGLGIMAGRTAIFSGTNGLGSMLGTGVTNALGGKPVTDGMLPSFVFGAASPIISGEGFLIGTGGDVVYGSKVSNAFSWATGLMAVGGAGLDPNADHGFLPDQPVPPTVPANVKTSGEAPSGAAQP